MRQALSPGCLFDRTGTVARLSTVARPGRFFNRSGHIFEDARYVFNRTRRIRVGSGRCSGPDSRRPGRIKFAHAHQTVIYLNILHLNSSKL